MSKASQVALAESGVALYSEPAEQGTLDAVQSACAECAPLIRALWGVSPPRPCRVFVMTSWWRFTFGAAPWPFRILYALLLPVWVGNMRRMWTLAAGWTLRYRSGPAVGIKPMRLWVVRDDSVGRRIYAPDMSEDERFRNVVCHELTHAFTAHLMLPMWLNEGVAMVTVDRLLGRETVRPETAGLLEQAKRPGRPGDYRGMPRMRDDAIVYQYVRGYWITRFLAETQPELLSRLLARRMGSRKIDRALADALGLPRRRVWRDIDSLAAAHLRAASTSDLSSR